MESLNATEQVRTPQEVFQLIADIDPKRNAVWAAVDEIKDPETARLFIEGCAEQVALHAEDESVRENPIMTTLGNIRYVAGLHIVSDPYKTNQQQLEDIMKPWLEGYALIPKPEQVEQ